jgi:hypothetical protein
LWDLNGHKPSQKLKGHESPRDAGTAIPCNFDFDNLIAKSCTWIRYYMTNPAAPEDEKALCAEELGLPLNSAVPSRVNWVANVRGFWWDLVNGTR